MTTLTIQYTLTAADIAKVLAENGGTVSVPVSTPTGSTGSPIGSTAPVIVPVPPVVTGGAIPKLASDGTKIVNGAATASVWNGLGIGQSIGSGQTGIFTMIMNFPTARAQLTFTEKGDAQDNIPRWYWISKTPGNLDNTAVDATRPNRSFIKAGNYPDGGVFGMGIVGGALNIVKDTSSYLQIASGSMALHVIPGEIWYLMVQNKDPRGNVQIGGNLTIFPNLINV